MTFVACEPKTDLGGRAFLGMVITGFIQQMSDHTMLLPGSYLQSPD
jgi:hypothetical protein